MLITDFFRIPNWFSFTAVVKFLSTYIFTIISDPEYAATYAEAVRKQMQNESMVGILKFQIWKSPKSPTEEDHKATLALLDLRLSYNDDFKNKKTPKNEIWKKIASKMNERGFVVGEGVEGKEKVRQKFANLQSTYIKYKDSQKRTGEGKLKRPKYFEELEEILGEKHKVEPILVIDSENISNTSDSECNKLNPGSSCSKSGSRFESVRKTLRPNEKRETLKELIAIQRDTQKIRTEEFSSMMRMFQEQNEQRNAQILLLIQKMGEKKSSRKRRRSSSSDE